jgi:hypothetical protein
MPSRQELMLKAKGLATYADKLSEVPEGSLSRADNIVIDKDGLISPRRGYELMDGVSSLGVIESMHTFYDKVWVHRDSTGNDVADKLAYFTGSVWTDLATSIATPTDLEKMRSMQFAKNIYFASDKGVQKLDDFAGDLVDSGAPEAIAATTTDAGAGTAIPASSNPGTNDVAVAYRIVWGYKDANENLILGTPSARTVFSHTLGSVRDVDVEIPIPPQITTAWFYQIYRSASIDYVAATPEIPSDELFLVFEGNPTQDEVDGISTLIHTDTQPESLLGTALYTNATQEGILNSNFEPPKCRDMAIYQNHAFYANTETKYTFEFQLLSVGAPGLQATDTITIDGNAYTAVAGVKETTDFTAAADVAGSLNQTYFLLQDEHGSVGFWIDVDDSGSTIPAGASAADRAVEITTVSTGDSATTVGSAVYAAIIADSKFEAGIDNADGTFTVQSTTYGAKTDGADGDTGFTIAEGTAGGPTLSAGDFVVADLGSVFQNIEDTARNLVKAINDDTRTSDLVAFYDSDTSPNSTDLPGMIRVKESDFAEAPAFTVSAAAVAVGSVVSDTWLPDLSSAQTSTNESKPNRIYFSKELQAEAVPINNFFDVGAANDKILRILPLREYLIILTENGMYKLSGVSQSSFQVTLLDNTVKLLAVDSAVVLDNNVYGFFDQGVCKVSDTVTIISRPIEGDLLEIRGDIGTKISSVFGISYESDRKYMMFTPTTDADGTSDTAYVYNTITRSWTNYILEKDHGIVNPVDDRVYLCAEDNVAKERKDFNEFDIADEQIDTTVTSVASNVITLPSSIVDMARVGDLFYQSNTKYSVITAKDEVADTITVENDLDFTTDPSEIRKYIQTTVIWNPVFAEKPSTLKHFSEITLLTNKPFREAVLGFRTIQSSELSSVTFTSGGDGAWGLFGWGEVEWGGITGITAYRTYIPRTKQRDAALTLSLVQNTINDNFEISGFSIIYRMIGPRIGR